MSAQDAINAELRQINVKLTQALCHQQDLTAKYCRQIGYKEQDLQRRSQELQCCRDELLSCRKYIASLEQMLMQYQKQQLHPQLNRNVPVAPNALFQPTAQIDPAYQQFQQQQLPASHNLFIEHNPAGTLYSPGKKGSKAAFQPFQQFQQPIAEPYKVIDPAADTNSGNAFFGHNSAGTLHSPSKAGRVPLKTLDKNAPLNLAALPKRVRSKKTAAVASSPAKPAEKRAPLSSPPAKQAPKRPASGPSPEKLSLSQKEASNVAQGKQPTKRDAVKSFTLAELRGKDWKASDNQPTQASCRPLLTAMYNITSGNVMMLKTAIDWLIKNVEICRNTFNQSSDEAANIVSNIDAWLQHNLGNNRVMTRGGTLETFMDEALQVICSAVLFNPLAMNVEQAKRMLPNIGGRRRLKASKKVNQKMIADDVPFFFHSRKVRKDAYWPLLCLFVREKICWNDKYTKVDTNYSRKIKCKQPIIRQMEGGGYEFLGWKTVEREMRMWYEETTLEEVKQLVLNSDEWRQLKQENPSVSLSIRTLREALCPSVRKPTFRSCVNERMSALSYIMEDFHAVIKNNETIRKRIDECPCLRHRTARDMLALNETPPRLWHNELRCLPSKFCAMATCPKKEQPFLRVGDKDPPKLRDKCCTKASCSSCGFGPKMGLGSPDCTAFKDCNELMEVTLWEEASRNGEGRTQREPTRHTGADRKTVAEVYRILADEVAPVALDHLGEAQWWHAHLDRRVATFEANEMLIFTDFSATPELVAKEVGNCHEAEHCVLDIIVVMDNPRVVEVMNDGVRTEKRIHDCTYWVFLGPTDGKGKKNDHRFHREALHSVVDFHAKKGLERGVEVTVCDMFSDNCGAQFKNQFCMGDAAWFSKRHSGMRFEHNYAPIFEFKGVHDGFGKVIKWRFKNCELKGIRIASAENGYSHLQETYVGRRIEWDKLEEEGSPKLLTRGPNTMTEVRAGYVADTIKERDRIAQEHGGDHVLYCNRTSVPKTVGDKAAKGLTEVYSMRGKRASTMRNGREFWELELASRACYCSVCCKRDSHSQPCPFAELRDIRRITVEDISNDPEFIQERLGEQAITTYFREKWKETKYINIKRMTQELDRLNIPFPARPSRPDLGRIFLSLQDNTTATTEEKLLQSLEEAILNPAEPSLDDDPIGETSTTSNGIPTSEEECPTDIDQLCINDIEDDETGGKDYNISDDELKTMTAFSAIDDVVLDVLLVKRGQTTSGSRAEKEERLATAIRPFQ